MSEKDNPPGAPVPEEEKPDASESKGQELGATEGEVEELLGLASESLLREQLEEALREKDQFRALAQRAQADLVNYRRRAGEEMDDLRRTANTQLLLQLLSFLDDLDRALALVPDDAVAPGWQEGLRLVRRSMDNILDLEGVSKIEAEGQPFEPWEFEAVQYQETEDAEEGRVIEVVRNGYKRHDKVLRAAQVVVAKRPEPETGHEANEQEEQ